VDEVIRETQRRHFNWSPETRALIKQVVCPAGQEPPVQIFAQFIHLCEVTGLDPLLREVWLIPRRRKQAFRQEDGSTAERWIVTWQPMAARDGYLAAAHRTGQLRGLETTVYPEDVSKVPTHATCRVHRAGWVVPVEITVALREYQDADSFLWRDRPRTMIAKVAESHALRRAFSLHGTLTIEELPLKELPPNAEEVVPEASTGPSLSEAEPAEPTRQHEHIAFRDSNDDELRAKLIAWKHPPKPVKFVPSANGPLAWLARSDVLEAIGKNPLKALKVQDLTREEVVAALSHLMGRLE